MSVGSLFVLDFVPVFQIDHRLWRNLYFQLRQGCCIVTAASLNIQQPNRFNQQRLGLFEPVAQRFGL